MTEGDRNKQSGEETERPVPPNKDPNIIGKLFDKNAGEAVGHDGASLPYSGGSQTAESGGKRGPHEELKKSE